MAEPKYGNYNGLGSRYKLYPEPSEAWVLDNDRKNWDVINAVDHEQDVKELTKETWEKNFPGAPPLPKNAFRL
jgi:hypothetical protein